MKVKGRPASDKDGGPIDVENGWAMPTYFKVKMSLLLAIMTVCTAFSIITDAFTMVLAGIFAIILAFGYYLVDGHSFIRFRQTGEYNEDAFKALTTCKAISGTECKALRDEGVWHSMIDTGEIEIRDIKRKSDGATVKRAFLFEMNDAFTAEDRTQFFRAYKSQRETMRQLDGINNLPGLRIPAEEDLPAPMKKPRISEEDEVAKLSRELAELRKLVNARVANCGTPAGCGEEEEKPRKKNRPGRPRKNRRR